MRKKTKQLLSVEAECKSCAGTGIYRGFAEPKGVGVVCLICGGTGKVIFSYTLFTTRKRRRDVQSVRLSAGSFVGTGVGPIGNSISYDDFFAGKMPDQSKPVKVKS